MNDHATDRSLGNKHATVIVQTSSSVAEVPVFFVVCINPIGPAGRKGVCENELCWHALLSPYAKGKSALQAK
jgi:hypothetical protein